MLKIQNFNTNQPKMCLGAEKCNVTQDSILNWLSFFSLPFIPSFPPRAEANISLSEIKKTGYKNTYLFFVIAFFIHS